MSPKPLPKSNRIAVRADELECIIDVYAAPLEINAIGVLARDLRNEEIGGPEADRAVAARVAGRRTLVILPLATVAAPRESPPMIGPTLPTQPPPALASKLSVIRPGPLTVPPVFVIVTSLAAGDTLTSSINQLPERPLALIANVVAVEVDWRYG